MALLQNIWNGIKSAAGNVKQELTGNPVTQAQTALQQGQTGAKNAATTASIATGGQNMSYNTSNGKAPSSTNPLLGVKAKTPGTTTPTTTLPANQVNNTPSPYTQSTTDGGTGNTPAYGSTFYDPKTGQPVGQNLFDPKTGQPLSNPNVTNVTGQPEPKNLGLYGSLINQLGQSTTNNKAITDQSQGYIDTTAKNIADLRGSAATNEQAYQTGMILPRAQGLAQNTAQTEAAQETALQGQLTNQLQGTQQALTGQGQTQSGLSSAASLAAPTSQFGLLTDPTTGQPVGGGSVTDNPQLNSAVQQAVALVKNGTSPNDPAITNLLSTFGYPGQAALNAALQQVNNGTYNPTALATQVQTNNAQGADYQKQATDLSTTLNSLNKVQSTATDFISKSGLNTQGSPFFNQQQNTTLGQLVNPSNVASYNAMVDDIKTYTAQILGNSGLNPTEVSSMVNAINPDGMTAPQLQAFLSNVDQLGQIRLEQLQSTSNNSYGSAGAYSGTQANTSGGTQTGPDAGYNASNIGTGAQTALGMGINFAGDITAIGGSILKVLGL